MLKINPITTQTSLQLKKTKENKITKQTKKQQSNLPTFTSKPYGVQISRFFQNFEKDKKDNYFKFNINSDTNKPYEPDIFQTAAAMNLKLGNDVLVTAPTGTGKTAIAKYAITNNLNNGKKTFYTTPLKALSNEKYTELVKDYGKDNVGLLTGDLKINPQAPIVIMTTEVYRNMVASSKLNKREDDEMLQDLSTVIFDELQYLGDVDRGGIWEQSIVLTPPNVQLLSLSATIGNNTEINDWISTTKNRTNALHIKPHQGYSPKLTNIKQTVLIDVPSENRHVPLEFNIERVSAKLKSTAGKSKKEKVKINKENLDLASSVLAKPTTEAYISITDKLKKQNKLPAIYFVFSKNESKKLLHTLSDNFEDLTTTDERKEIENIIKRYKKEENIYLGEQLDIDSLMKGFAIHNSGLLPAQKKLVEELFQKKLVKVVIATETLSAGINMPAKTTVISSLRKPSSTPDGYGDGKRQLTPNEFHQMAGRAGRRGLDTQGYCYLLSCNANQDKIYNELINSPANNLESKFKMDYSFIMNYLANFDNYDELKHIFSKTLYAFDSKTKHSSNDKTKELLNDFEVKAGILQEENFIDDNSEVTLKGHLLQELNGYEQIPIINAVHDKLLENLTPTQLVGVVSAFANIETKESDNNTNPDIPTLNRDDDEKLTDTIFEVLDNINNYNEKMSKLTNNTVCELNFDAIDHLYTWAELNSQNTSSRENWKELLDDMHTSIKDEGALFKEITLTVDLLKQLNNVCEKGIKLSATESYRLYYSKLQENIVSALKLIQKEPADDRKR